MKDIRVFSLKQFYQKIKESAFDPKNTIAIISSSYSVDEERLKGIRYIVCQYDDVDDEVLGRCFTLVEANKIARFFKSYEKEVSTVLCICDSGCRRSSAIAAALYRFYGREDEEIKKVWQDPAYEPNPLVYRLMARALGTPTSDADIDLRIWENRNAFRKRIKGELS